MTDQTGVSLTGPSICREVFGRLSATRFPSSLSVIEQAPLPFELNDGILTQALQKGT
jgi:hypothetical protein